MNQQIGGYRYGKNVCVSKRGAARAAKCTGASSLWKTRGAAGRVLGVGGMLARMQGGVLAELREGGLGADRPYALLMGGSNDVFYSGSDAAAQENMGAMIHQLFSVGVLPVVGIPLPADAPHAPRAILKRRSGR